MRSHIAKKNPNEPPQRFWASPYIPTLMTTVFFFFLHTLAAPHQYLLVFLLYLTPHSIKPHWSNFIGGGPPAGAIGQPSMLFKLTYVNVIWWNQWNSAILTCTMTIQWLCITCTVSWSPCSPEIKIKKGTFWINRVKGDTLPVLTELIRHTWLSMRTIIHWRLLLQLMLILTQRFQWKLKGGTWFRAN